MININDTKYCIARRDGVPALVRGGTHILVFALGDRRTIAHLPIDQLDF